MWLRGLMLTARLPGPETLRPGGAPQPGLASTRGVRTVDGLELTRRTPPLPAPAALEAIAAKSASQMDAENFPVALRIVPARPRAHLRRIYGFARFIDDVGDTADGDRLALLDLVEADVRALPNGGATLTPVRALAPIVNECESPLDPFLDLIEANRLDQRVSSYPDFSGLLDYCRLSAAPIGRLVLYVAGAATEANIADSDQVCAALQVLEHCQDVGEDARMGRVYLPAGELAAAGLDPAALLAASTSGRLRSVVSVQVERSVDLLAPGRPLVRRLTGWAKLAVAGYVGGGLATVDALRSADFDVLAQAVRPSRGRTARHALRLIAHR
jgi:squalene synthase HpnC